MTRTSQTTTRSGRWHHAHRDWFGFAVATVAFAATLLARYAIDAVIARQALPLLFIIPVALAAYAGGLWPTVAATFAGVVAELLLFIGWGRWDQLTTSDHISVGLFVGVGLLLSVTSEAMHRARARVDTVRRRLQQEVEAHRKTEGRVAELNEELHRTLHDVRQSQQQLQFVIDAMPQKVFTASAAGVPQYCNPQWAEYTGLSSEEITAGDWVRTVHPDDRRAGTVRWVHAMRSGNPFVFEHRMRRKDGVYRWHISRAVPQRDAAGHIVLWVGSSTDVHELKVAQESLREADALKDEFLATLAHELRNPLAPMVTSAEILAHDPDPVASEQARATIRRQVAHMVRLVDDLLDVSRITRNVLQVRKEKTTLGPIMAAALETVRDAANDSNLSLEISVPDEPIYLNADPVRLTQVFSNLLNNACKYTPKGGSIWVTAEANGDDVVVRVRDTGIGIPSEKLSSIFGAFARIDREVGDQRPRGLGIGLALVRRVVDLHGGTVVAESSGEGGGSEFTVRLPIAPRPRKESLAPRETVVAPGRVMAESGNGERRPQRVIVVDDNVDAAEALETMLALAGIETRVAHDGIEALYAAAEFRPDAMVVDIGMPKLDGYEVARRLRAAPWSRSLRLVALSGWAQESDRQKSREAGFDVHLAKPVTFGALMDALVTTRGDGAHGQTPAAPERSGRREGGTTAP
jgi:PAS domain S-box-containing protein